MPSLPFRIEKEFNKINFYFLAENDFVQSLDLNKSQFGLDLSEILQINSDESGVPVDLDVFDQLTNFLYSNIRNHALEKPSLCIKNNQVTSFFYTLSEFPNAPKVKLLNLWEFSTFFVEMNREEWVSSHQLELRNCCVRNYFIKLAKDSDYGLITNLEELDRFCLFPKKFINVDGKLCVHLLNATDPEVEKQYLSLNLSMSNLITNNKFGSFPDYIRFLSADSYLNSTNVEFRPYVRNFLNHLKHDSINNLNCQDLLVDISIENQGFKKYIDNCLVTIFSVLFFAVNKNNEILGLEKNSKLIFCSFLF